MSPAEQQDFAFTFLSILLEGAPFILLGTLISGIIDVYLPSGTLDRILPKRTLPAVLVAGLLGAVLPVCECAVVPVIRRLIKKGLPVSSALTYMLAAPIVNPITAFSTWKAFTRQEILIGMTEQGPRFWDASIVMTASRLGLGFGVAVAVGLIVAAIPLNRILRPKLLASLKTSESHNHAHGHDHSHQHDENACCNNKDEHSHHHHHSGKGIRKMIAAMRACMRDFIDVGIYFTVGIAITALFNTGIAPGAEWLDSLAENPIAAPAALMGLAFVLSLCSTSDAFIAAILMKFKWGAKLAFMTFGPMMDIKLIFLYQTVLKRRFIALLAIGLFLAIGLACIGMQAFLDTFEP